MRVAFVIFEDLTALDFVGVFDAVTRLKTMKFLPELEWDICSLLIKQLMELDLSLLQQK